MRRLWMLTAVWCWALLGAFAQGTPTQTAADSLDEQALVRARESDHWEAVRLAQEAVRLRAAQGGVQTASYALSAARLSKFLSYAGRQKEAIAWGTKSLAVTEQIAGKQNAEYAQTLSDLAGYYSRAGDYQEALRLGTEALNIRDSVMGKAHAEYAQSLNNVARYHSYLGNYMEAISIGRKAMELKELLLGTNNADYAQSVSNLAGYMSRIGNYSEAIRLGQEALRIREKTLGRNHPDYAESLNNLAKYHYFVGQYDVAIRLEKEALATREAIYGKRHPEYATALSNLADYYQKTGNTEEAMRCGTEAMDIRKAVLGTQHPDYAESLSNLAGYHFAVGNLPEAVALEEQVIGLQQQLLGEEHPAYAQSLCKMATFYSANGQDTEAESFAFKATQQFTKVILNTFADLTAAERDLFWMKVKPWFTNTILQLTEKSPTDMMVSSAYNGTLLAKGLLLKSEEEMVNMLMESGDAAAVDAYRKLQANRSLLLRQFETPRSLRTLNIDSLQRVITKQERRLVKRSKTYGNYTQPLRIGWERIAALLRTDDCAVEFVHYRSAGGTGRYAALVVNRQSRHPVFVPLMDDQQLAAIPPKELYTSDRLTRMLWQPLEKYLKKARRVFFAPAGELYNIAVESLPLWEPGEGKPSVMSDCWNIFRLSSTREIALSAGKQRRKQPSISVYGGMNYDAVTTTGNKSAHIVRKGRSDAAKYLPGTKKEAEEIGRRFGEHGIATRLFVGDAATENAFKQLSGHCSSLVHIATHGFYWTDSEVQEGVLDEKLQFLSMYGNMDDADKALSRSGLLFTGANHALRGNRMLKEDDDGVLTAKEISLLNLRGLDLLVLSACQTGLGKVTGDGVFGLQRGFKKAGAQTLLMSLWKVDDAATRLLMSRFYDYLMEGVGKHEALRRAQQYLRTLDVETASGSKRRAFSARKKRAKKNSVKKLYQDPYYWAAFILLDAL